jgi:hypothetical protein
MNRVRQFAPYLLLAFIAMLVVVGSSYDPTIMGLSSMAFGYALIDLKWSQGTQNLGGIVGDIYYCPIEDIASFPALSAAGVCETATSSLFVCKTGKKFIAIYHTAETGKIDSNSVGDIDGKGIENFIEFFYPGNKLDLKNFSRFALNTPCVVIAKNTSGEFEIIGVVNLDESTTTLTGDIPAYLESVNYSSGGKRADRKGKTFKFRQPGSPHDGILYKGTIPLTPAP